MAELPVEIWTLICGEIALGKLEDNGHRSAMATLRSVRATSQKLSVAASTHLYRQLPVKLSIHNQVQGTHLREWERHCHGCLNLGLAPYVRELTVPYYAQDLTCADAGVMIREIAAQLPFITKMTLPELLDTTTDNNETDDDEDYSLESKRNICREIFTGPDAFPKLRELSLECNPFHVSEVIDSWTITLGRLTTLNMHIPDVGADAADWSRPGTQAVNKALQSARSLKTLMFVGGQYRDPHTGAMFGGNRNRSKWDGTMLSLKDLHFAHLTRLHLTWSRLSGLELSELLLQHAKVLKHLQLEMIFLVDGEWSGVFSAIAKANLGTIIANTLSYAMAHIQSAKFRSNRSEVVWQDYCIGVENGNRYDFHAFADLTRVLIAKETLEPVHYAKLMESKYLTLACLEDVKMDNGLFVDLDYFKVLR